MADGTRDGTLAPAHGERILAILPDARIVGAEEKQLQLDAILPSARFPILREQRFQYPLVRKLHLHAAESGWKLYLDSDMLFHRPPVRLLQWLRHPAASVHLVDTPGDYYGYAHSVLESTAGHRVPPSVNSGIVGLNSETVDWERVEYWASQLIHQHGMVEQFLEQTLTAMLFGDTPREALPADEYLVMPGRNEVMRPTAALHHYTGTSRPWYFRFAWPRVLKTLA